MTKIIIGLLVTLCAGALQAQDVVYYKFESGTGDRVINYGDVVPGIPRVGVVEPHSPLVPNQAWSSGRWGGGLRAGPQNASAGFQVDTGWDHQVTGDVTVAFFFKLVHPLPNNSGGLMFGGNANLSPGGGLQMAMLGFPPQVGQLQFVWRPSQSSGSQQVTLAQNLAVQAFLGWTHIAINIDRTAGVARWYVDGIPQLPQAIGNWPNILATARHQVIGDDSDAYFAFDEFRICLRNVPAAEIASWATQQPAAAAPFGDACHPFGLPVLLHGLGGGLPVLGNGAHELRVFGLPGSAVVLAVGSNNYSFQGAPLPLDLGAVNAALGGCFLNTSADLLLLTGSIPPTGSLGFPLPVPNFPPLGGVVLYSQALLDVTILGTTALTNAYASSIGF